MQLFVLSLIISNHFLSYIVRIKAVIVHIFIQSAQPENLGQLHQVTDALAATTPEKTVVYVWLIRTGREP